MRSKKVAKRTKVSRAGRRWTLLTAKELKKAREAAGQSRQELADAIGVSPGAIQGWESESGTPTEDVQQKLCKHLGLTPRAVAEAPAEAAAAPPGPETVAVAMAPAPAKAVAEKRRAAAEAPGNPANQREYAVASIVSAMVHKGLLQNTSDVYDAIPRVAKAL
jgi:transcriptional regulator with XRE-family HTH domain